MINMVPHVTWPIRVRDESIGGDNPYRWDTLDTDQVFKGKKVLIFSLPGAFTPTCSTFQVPGFEALAEDFYELGISDVYVMSVNDTFVMNKWAQQVVDGGLKHVKVIPDGNGEFTDQLGMLVDKHNLGFGKRSWRYAFVAIDGEIQDWFEEPGRCDNAPDDPYGETDPEHILEVLRNK